MPQTPPRLASADPGTQPGYAPISWTAVASLGVAGLFVLLLLVLGYSAFREHKPLIEPLLLALPGLAVVLAFVARRQIRAAEGTRAGIQYANWGWWVAVVSGLGYAAYLGAVEFDVRRQAQSEFVAWSEHLKDVNPSDPKDQHFYAALYTTLPPGERAGFSARDAEAMEKARQLDAVAFRACDLVRICARNRGAVEFKVHGLRDWQEKQREISCVLTATLVTPEGEHGLVVPMRAVIDEKKGRRWQVSNPAGGFVQSRNLTRYGWMIEHLEEDSKRFGADFLGAVNTPELSRLAYLGYVAPGWDVDRANRLLGGSIAVAGAPSVVPPLFPSWKDHLAREVFATPSGAPSAAQQATFMYLWTTPRHIVPPGTTVRGNPDIGVAVRADGDRIEARLPAELVLAGEGPTATVARGRMVLRVAPEATAGVAAELAAARQAGSGLSEKPPADLRGRRYPWRVAHLESDLQPLPSADPRQNMRAGGVGPP